MTLLRNLSVGWKLALSAAAAVLMLCALVALVRWNMDQAREAQAAEMRTLALRRISNEVVRQMAEAQSLLRDMLLAQTAEEADRPLQVMQDVVTEARRGLDTLLEQAPEAMRADLGRAMEAQQAWFAAAGQLAEARRSLITLRDGRLFPLMAQYDQAFEAVSANIEFDLPEHMREDARHRMMAFHAAVNDGRTAIQRFLATAEEAQARRLRQAAAQQTVHFRALLTQVGDRMAGEFNRLRDATEELATVSAELADLQARTVQIRIEAIEPQWQRLSDALSAIRREATSAMERESARARALQAASVDAVMWTGGAVALLLLLSGWATARAITRPLNRLQTAIAQIASGDAGRTVPDQARGDEIGRIARELETLRGTVQRAFAQQQMIEQLPAGVMTADPNRDFAITYLNPAMRAILSRVESVLPCRAEEVEGRSMDMFHREPAEQRAILADPARLPFKTRFRLGEEVVELSVSAIRDAAGGYVGPMAVWTLATAQARLADNFEADVGGVVEAVAAAAGQMQSIAQAVAGAAETSGREADAVAEVSQRAGAEVQAVAASAEELAASVSEITRQVAEGASVARAAAEEARATDATVQGLAQAAQRIGDVVRLIGDIAGQTNLLALNATIEAARAGEAGKGFAVVAGEVKTLAGQTAKATEEISAQIGAIQATTEQAVTALRSIGATIERLNEVTTAIAAAVEEQGSATQEIARSAAQVAAGTTAAAQRIEDVRRAARDTGEASASMLGAANDLTARAGMLRERTGEFLAGIRRA
jgi:methyl-accepting chemotaxis protein